MAASTLSESIEMYLKSLAELDAYQPVAISRLAERLGVTQVSATEMVKKLVEQGLVDHLPYKGVILTDTGKKLAFSVIRRQRLWECFLHDHLNIEWARIYDFACDLEHATAPEVTEALSAFLGAPTTCPHGDPIPATDGSFEQLTGIPLSALSVGQSGTILAVLASNSEVLQYLHTRDVLPGNDVTVLEIAPLQGPLTLKIGDKEIAVGLQMADYVLVQPA